MLGSESATTNLRAVCDNGSKCCVRVLAQYHPSCNTRGQLRFTSVNNSVKLMVLVVVASKKHLQCQTRHEAHHASSNGCLYIRSAKASTSIANAEKLVDTSRTTTRTKLYM